MQPQIIATIISGLISLIAVGISYFYNKRIIAQKNNEDEKKEIYKKLNEFFGPFLAMRKKNKMLFDIFVGKYRRDNPDFKTLVFLLDGNKLDGNDKIIFDEIINNNDILEKLLIEKAGLIDSVELRDNYFPKFLTHCNIIKLAYQSSLIGENERFKNFAFPKGIDEYVEKEFEKYKSRLTELNNVRGLF